MDRGVEDTIAYYRAVRQSAYRDPDLKAVFERLDDPISVPTRVLCGTRDMRKEMLPRQADWSRDVLRPGLHVTHWRTYQGFLTCFCFARGNLKNG